MTEFIDQILNSRCKKQMILILIILYEKNFIIIPMYGDQSWLIVDNWHIWKC